MKIEFKSALTILGSLALLTGCASETMTKPAATARVEPTQAATIKVEKPDTEAVLQSAAATPSTPSAPFEGSGWKSLFDGRTLSGWQVTDFAGHGAVQCESGLMVIEMGASLTGVNWTNDVPKMNYEIALDAMKVQGSDFFCGLTFPVGETHCSLIVGGWGGTVTGLSSIDGQDASENETTSYKKYEPGKWYRVRVRVTDKKIEAWIDQEKVVDLLTAGRKIELRFGEIEMSKPLGIATYQTRAALREIKLRRLE